MREIAALFDDPKMTLVIRSRGLEGDVIVTNDEAQDAITAIKKHCEQHSRRQSSARTDGPALRPVRLGSLRSTVDQMVADQRSGATNFAGGSQAWVSPHTGIFGAVLSSGGGASPTTTSAVQAQLSVLRAGLDLLAAGAGTTGDPGGARCGGPDPVIGIGWPARSSAGEHRRAGRPDELRSERHRGARNDGHHDDRGRRGAGITSFVGGNIFQAILSSGCRADHHAESHRSARRDPRPLRSASAIGTTNGATRCGQGNAVGDPHDRTGGRVALQAVAKGTANEGQQQRAWDYILRALCETDRMSFWPGGDDGRRASDFAEGKRWVGIQLKRIEKMRPDLRGVSPPSQENTP